MKSIDIDSLVRQPITKQVFGGFGGMVKEQLYHDIWVIFHNAIWAPVIIQQRIPLVITIFEL